MKSRFIDYRLDKNIPKHIWYYNMSGTGIKTVMDQIEDFFILGTLKQEKWSNYKNIQIEFKTLCSNYKHMSMVYNFTIPVGTDIEGFLDNFFENFEKDIYKKCGEITNMKKEMEDEYKNKGTPMIIRELWYKTYWIALVSLSGEKVIGMKTL
jgi:hypothetical protein